MDVGAVWSAPVVSPRVKEQEGEKANRLASPSTTIQLSTSQTSDSAAVRRPAAALTPLCTNVAEARTQRKPWAAQPPLENFRLLVLEGCVIVARIRKQWPSDQAGPPLTRWSLMHCACRRNAIILGSSRTSAEAVPDGERTKLRERSPRGSEVPPDHWTSPRVDCRIV